MSVFQKAQEINRDASVATTNNDQIREQVLSMADMIKSFAIEIEKTPLEHSSSGKKDDIPVSRETGVLKKSLALPSAPAAEETLTQRELNNCFFKTRTGGFKSYQIVIDDGNVVFSRPNSSKQQELCYELATVQFIKKVRNIRDDNSEEDAKTSKEFFLQIICNNNMQRFVYFNSEEALNHWHEEILKAQGYYEDRIDSYQPIGRLGQGSFGLVILAQHKNSKVKVAVKIINKAKIQRAFGDNGQEFKELDIMHEVA